MKKLMIGLISLGIFLCLSLIFAAPETPSLTDVSKPIRVSEASPVITIQFKANRTTGYQWFLSQYNHDLVRPLDHHYVAPNTTMVGAPGVEVFRFKMLNSAFAVPQAIEIGFSYLRPWEPVAPGQMQKITILTQSNE